jgi:nucleotide-binding universal stress UspA family protein
LLLSQILHAWSDLRVSDLKELFPNFDWDTHLSEEEETLAERLAGWHERYPDVGIRRKIEVGEPARPLLEASKLAQLIVVGSHGGGGFPGIYCWARSGRRWSTGPGSL